jgi:hypothetical protein
VSSHTPLAPIELVAQRIGLSQHRSGLAVPSAGAGRCRRTQRRGRGMVAHSALEHRVRRCDASGVVGARRPDSHDDGRVVGVRLEQSTVARG